MSVVLITGCSSGFGEATAIAFAQRGHTVVATMRDPAKASAALTEASKSVECVQLDVTDAAARDRVVQGVLDQHGRIDILINNAGQLIVSSIEDTDETLARHLFDVNYFAVVEMMRKVMPIMREQGNGRIVNVTAMGGIFSTALFGSYCASKHALDGISAVADIEMRGFGVRVATVLPGQFVTSIAKNAPPSTISAPYQPIQEALTRDRAGRAADFLEDVSGVVDAVVSAATDADPTPRALAGKGMVEELRTVVAELDRLQRYEAKRAGFG